MADDSTTTINAAFETREAADLPSSILSSNMVSPERISSSSLPTATTRPVLRHLAAMPLMMAGRAETRR